VAWASAGNTPQAVGNSGKRVTMVKSIKVALATVIGTGALIGALVGGMSIAAGGNTPQSVCVVASPSEYPPAPSGSLGHVDWTLPHNVTKVTVDLHVGQVAKTTFVNAWQGKINGVPMYVGVQQDTPTTGKLIFSEFGAAFPAAARPGERSTTVVGTGEGPFTSVRTVTGAVHGDYKVTLSRQGNGWYSATVNGLTIGSLYFGGLPTGIASKGLTWVEDYANNAGPTFVRPGLTKLSVAVPQADRGITRYSDVPDTNITATGKTVRFTTGGNTARCALAGQTVA